MLQGLGLAEGCQGEAEVTYELTAVTGRRGAGAQACRQQPILVSLANRKKTWHI